jgi:hypothetical protein
VTLDGFLLFQNPEIRRRLDLKLFFPLNHDIAKERRSEGRVAEQKLNLTNFGRRKTILRKWCGAATENSTRLCFAMPTLRAIRMRKLVWQQVSKFYQAWIDQLRTV